MGKHPSRTSAAPWDRREDWEAQFVPRSLRAGSLLIPLLPCLTQLCKLLIPWFLLLVPVVESLSFTGHFWGIKILCPVQPWNCSAPLGAVGCHSCIVGAGGRGIFAWSPHASLLPTLVLRSVLKYICLTRPSNPNFRTCPLSSPICY